jgi:alpha-L-rhamnosidase
MLKIQNLRTENLTTGCVTDNPNPQFSFSLESDRENVELKQAVISCNGWKKVTKEQIGIRYDGLALNPFTSYEVTVTAEDNYGDTYTKSMTFETGRMNTSWSGRWITDREYHFTEKKISPKTMTFRKSIQCKKEIKSAKIYATALGIYELILNGEKVGEDYFAPGYTSYKNQIQYQTYDITEKLIGTNELVTVVGGGWAVGAFNYKRVNRVYAKRQALLLEIHITYTDNTKEIIGTDESWQVTEDGNYQMTEFYNGETYDATIDLNKIVWRNAGLENVKIKPEIIAQYGVPVRAHEEFKPVSCVKAPSGMLIYDFGQNFAGVIKANIIGKKGQMVTFGHAEILMNGELYTEPLRTAKQQATYICLDGMQSYSPRMTYMGFRYVGVTGIKEEHLDLSAVAVYSDIEESGSFECSNELINKLQNAIRWGAKSNFVDIPTDCPQRDERMGWTGDIAVFSPTASYNFNMSRFYEKWLKDVKAEQRRGGGIPVVVPHTFVPMQWEIMVTMAVDHWGDACIWVPWAEYLARGDKRILKTMYPTMKKYVKACKFWAGLFSVGKHRRIWRLLHHYGDWCAPNVNMWTWMGRGKWTATAAMARSSANLAQIARILGENEDAAYYEKLSKETADAYRSILMDKDCKIKNEFQTAYVLPLHYNMLNGKDKKKTAKNLVEIVRRDGHHINTGFPGTPYILFALADNGYAEDAYKMLLKDTCPSWLYEVKAGGTTIWERWDALREDGTCNTGADDGTNGMTSFNHYASGAVGDFLYRRVAGIEAKEGGYKTFKIAPLLGGNISYAKGTVMTNYGEISSEWRVIGDIFSITLKVPVGTTCVLTTPNGNTKTLGSGSYSFEERI